MTHRVQVSMETPAGRVQAIAPPLDEAPRQAASSRGGAMACLGPPGPRPGVGYTSVASFLAFASRVFEVSNFFSKGLQFFFLRHNSTLIGFLSFGKSVGDLGCMKCL